MKVICAWCQTIILEDDSSNLLVSHGICEKCRNKYYPKSGRPKRQKKKEDSSAPERYKPLESKKAVDIFRKNLDEITQPILRSICLLNYLSKELDQEDGKYYLVKKMENELDETLSLIAHIYQTVWFNLEYKCNILVMRNQYQPTW